MQNVYFERERVAVDDASFAEFCARFREIPAGGGLVRNKEGQYLLICRHQLWDLPKGKQEPDESIETCALREVEEEVDAKIKALALPRDVSVRTALVYDGNFGCERHFHKVMRQ